MITGDGGSIAAPPAVVLDHASNLRAFAQRSEDDIKMYPNPANETLNIEILQGEYDEIMIFSSNGTLMQSIVPTTALMSVDVSQYTAGMYFVRVVSEGLAYTKRFVKN